MEERNFISHLKYLISENKEEKVFEFLNHNFLDCNNFNEIVLLSNRFKKYKKEKRLGVLEDEERKRNEIILNLLQLLSEINDDFDIRKMDDNNILILEKTVKKVRQTKLIRSVSINSLQILGVSYLFYLGFGIGFGFAIVLLLIIAILYYTNLINFTD